MRKGLIEAIILGFGLLSYIATAMAQVNHVSINSRQFEVNHLPQLKVNVVAQNDDVSRLGFYIRQLENNKVEQQKLTVQAINRFLLQLNGSEIISDSNAQLIITEATSTGAVTLAVMAIFDAPYSLNGAKIAVNSEHRPIPDANLPVMSTSKHQQVDHRVAQVPSVPSSTIVPTQQVNCLLERDNSDTLWRIANRYKQQWDTSVYGAMLAIFEANLLAFSKQKIHLLLKDVPLNCPSTMILAQYDNKAVDKKVFEAIEAKHANQ